MHSAHIWKLPNLLLLSFITIIIFSILPDSTIGTIISVSNPLISKIKKQTFQFNQSPKALTHYSIFLSLSVSDFSSMASLVARCLLALSLVDPTLSLINSVARRLSLVGFFRRKTKRKVEKNEGERVRGKGKRKVL